MTNRTYAYCRVSTSEQSTANQIHAILQAGYNVESSRVVEETISGGVEAMQRPAFNALVAHKLEKGDTLIVLKLDRLGRDNIDVQNTIQMLMDKGINVICLDLPMQDLSKPEARLMLQMIASFAEFEKSRLIERTKEGLARAVRDGKKLGRPAATDTTERVQTAKNKGLTQSEAKTELGLGIATIKRHWNK